MLCNHHCYHMDQLFENCETSKFNDFHLPQYHNITQFKKLTRCSDLLSFFFEKSKLVEESCEFIH